MAAAKIEDLQDMFRWEKRGLHAVLTYCPKVDTKIQKIPLGATFRVVLTPIKALGEYFPQLASLLNEKDSTDYNLTLEISLKEIFILCPRNRCRLDRYGKLQEYLNKNYNTTLIIKSQKTK